MIPLGYLVIKRLEETRKKHSLDLVEALSLTSLDEAEPEGDIVIGMCHWIVTLLPPYSYLDHMIRQHGVNT